MKDQVSNVLLWMDLEMTGLDPQNQRIIEVAALVTDFSLIEKDYYHAVIHQPPKVLRGAEDWPKQHLSALFAESAASAIDETVAIGGVAALIKKYCPDQPIILAGNSIHQDRRFIQQWWPQVEALLHYRMLDVTSYKVWLMGAKQKKYEKRDVHRALDDIRESIAEFKWSLEQLSRSPDDPLPTATQTREQ